MSESKQTGSVDAAKRALWKQFKGKATPDKKGYVIWPDENLLPGIELKDFEDDLRKGAGDELRIKFCAVHSSAALAVNHFTHFKKYPQHLHVLGRSTFEPPTFEHQCPTGLGGTPPNLDVWLDSKEEIIAIESKLLEYFTPKEAKYATSYKREAVIAEDCWWDVLEGSKIAGKRNLDVAQLVKHYLGLQRFMKEQNGKKKVTLLYLFWEPLNAASIDVCRRHRDEIEAFTQSVSNSQIQFATMPYPKLWDEWSRFPELEAHVSNLRARYQVTI